MRVLVVPGAAAVSLGTQVLFVFLHDVAGDFDALVVVVGWDHEVLVCGDDECVGEYKRLANSYAGMALLPGFGRSRREAEINYICDNLPATWNVTQARSRLWRMLDELDAHGWCGHEIFVPHIAGLSCPITSSTHRYSLTISGDAETIPPGRHRALARLLLDTAGAIGRVIK